MIRESSDAAVAWADGALDVAMLKASRAAIGSRKVTLAGDEDERLLGYTT